MEMHENHRVIKYSKNNITEILYDTVTGNCKQGENSKTEINQLLDVCENDKYVKYEI